MIEKLFFSIGIINVILQVFAFKLQIKRDRWDSTVTAISWGLVKLMTNTRIIQGFTFTPHFHISMDLYLNNPRNRDRTDTAPTIQSVLSPNTTRD